MKREFATIFLIAITVGALAVIVTANMHFVNAQMIKNVSGTISSDTTWTKGTEYNITGPISVVNGAILTIQSGVKVDYNPNFSPNIQVDGILIAKGTSADPIIFYGYLTIAFMQDSTGWTERTSLGSIIENTYGAGIVINNTSPKIDQNTVASISIRGGSPIISHNIVSGNMVWSKDPYNDPPDPVRGQITVNGGSPTIFNNTIYYSYYKTHEGGQFFGPNLAYGIAITGSNSALISDNTFQDVDVSIYMSAGSPTIQRNYINTINTNTNSNLGTGIIVTGSSNPAIINNTIIENSIGLNIYDDSQAAFSMIAYNNFEGNSKYNIYMGQLSIYDSTASDINASYNWWGTTDPPTINQTIYDHKNNYNVGTVTFTPILTSPNGQTAPNPTAVISTSEPLQTNQSNASSTPVSTQNPNTLSISQIDLLLVIAILLAVIAGLLATLVSLLHRRNAK